MVDDKLWARPECEKVFFAWRALKNGSVEGSGLRILRVLRSMTETHGILRGSILENAACDCRQTPRRLSAVAADLKVVCNDARAPSRGGPVGSLF
jgi:hypothetical protein